MFWILLALSLLGMALGALMVFAGGMSDAPAAGEESASQGGILVLIGLAVLVFSFVARHYGWLPV